MKIYGSLNNRLMESSKQESPKVGMGATITMYTDRHACTIVEVVRKGISRIRVAVQEDRAERTDANGMSESQSYRYEPNKEAKIRWFSKRKNGRYVEEGSKQQHTPALIIGVRDSYHDYSF